MFFVHLLLLIAISNLTPNELFINARVLKQCKLQNYKKETCEVSQVFSYHPFLGTKHLAALVLARGGSKGIKLKNLAKINDKTLLRIVLDAIRKVKTFDSIWVSTDNLEIFVEAQKLCESVKIHWRAADTASDTATSLYAVQEFLENHQEVDSVALIQCTSPLIRHVYLDRAVGVFGETETCNSPRSRFDCVFAVYRSYKLRWSLSPNGDAFPLNFDTKNRPRRQDWSGELIESGMFYFATRKIIETGVFQNDKAVFDVNKISQVQIETSN